MSTQGHKISIECGGVLGAEPDWFQLKRLDSVLEAREVDVWEILY